MVLTCNFATCCVVFCFVYCQRHLAFK